MPVTKNRSNLGGHILPASGTMLGVCMTVLSIVKVLGADAHLGKWVDDLLAVDALLFLASAIFSYLSLRTPEMEIVYEVRADKIFMMALLVMGFAVLALTYEIL